MSRRQRIKVPGGTYHVIQRGSKHHLIFPQPDDYGLFEHLLSLALKRTGARLHAYCWAVEAVHLALEIQKGEVSRFMQGLKSSYARRIQRRAGESGPFFRQRYHAVLIDPGTYLLQLIHYLHYLPVFAGLAQNPDAYPYSSHRAYLCTGQVPWVHTHTALRLLGSCDDNGVAYRRLMAEAPSSRIGALLDHGDPNTPGILSDSEFVGSLSYGALPDRNLSLSQITTYVCCLLDVPREYVLSRSRERKFALARALIAWYATERRVANLNEVARYLGRSKSTLSLAITRHRACHSDLFRVDVFSHLVPLGPATWRGHDQSTGCKPLFELPCRFGADN